MYSRKIKRDKFDIKQRLWYEVRSEYMDGIRKKYGKAYKQFMIYAERAALNKKCFYLTLDDFAALKSMSCHYCGDIPSGYDRMDGKIGYKRSNVVPSCAKCNMMKRAMTYHEFVKHITKMSKQLRGK